ncbi:hypothetical protein [Sphingobium sp. Leaf26]|uniref:hypothetical protein n=1 Tax=Sphingobium sp. Leaf26 TaxID=1735693 RepID=UPI0006F3F40C|nr:hypothetical protein [Sphingobium sp. Leaf26]
MSLREAGVYYALVPLNGAIVQFVGINAFIVTLGTLTAVRGLVLILTDGRSLMVARPEVLAQMLAFESGRVSAIWVLLVIGAALLGYGLARRRVYAVGSNAAAALPGVMGQKVCGQ